jgi:hypothetical protein
LLFAMALLGAPAVAGPVICTTTMEAPDPSAEMRSPVQVTTCESVETTRELVNRRFFTWRAPYARGVDMVHQFTDLLGIAVGGAEGNRLMGFGFPDQAVIWDASAIGNTVEALIEEQSPARPWRTMDLPNGFDSSLAMEDQPMGFEIPVEPTPLQPLW